MLFELDDAQEQNARMKVVGVGGAGGNAVNRMIEERVAGVEFISVNTDAQALAHSDAHRKIQVGRTLTRGLGSGSKPDIGREALLEDQDEVLRRFPVRLTAADVVPPDRAGKEGPATEVRDAMGRLVERIDPRGRRERWQYDRNGNLVAYHDPDGAIHGRRIASWNLVAELIDPVGNTTSIEYSLREQITKVVDANETASEFAYDGCDRLIQVTRHGQLRERYDDPENR